jgi:hypothetical protein
MKSERRVRARYRRTCRRGAKSFGRAWTSRRRTKGRGWCGGAFAVEVRRCLVFRRNVAHDLNLSSQTYSRHGRLVSVSFGLETAHGMPTRVRLSKNGSERSASDEIKIKARHSVAGSRCTGAGRSTPGPRLRPIIQLFLSPVASRTIFTQSRATMNSTRLNDTRRLPHTDQCLTAAMMRITIF